MIPNDQKTSLLVPFQLPEYIRDEPDYANFVLFLQAYYQWMEQNNGVTDLTKNILTYQDIDTTTQQFLQYFYQDLLPYFPTDIVSDPIKVAKFSRELYQTKGTEASYKFLFKVLYGTDVDFFYTKDAVLKASGGKWYAPTSLKLSTDVLYINSVTYNNTSITLTTFVPHNLQSNSAIVVSGLTSTTNPPNGNWNVNQVLTEYTFTYNVGLAPTDNVVTSNTASIYIPNGTIDKNFLHVNNFRIFGETSKSIATIENAIIAGNKVEVFISNIERLFQSGEYVRVVDTNNQDVLFNGQSLRAKIVGQIGQIFVDPQNRGKYYRTGDPVIVYGGLNSSTGHGAVATIGDVTPGSIQSINVNNQGYGYNISNSIIQITNGGGATAHVATVNLTDTANTMVATFPTDSISRIANSNVAIGNTTINSPYGFLGNTNATYTSTLANAFTFASITTYPLSSVVVDGGGSNIIITPSVLAETVYTTDAETVYQNTAFQGNLSSLGILAPIQIANTGSGYAVNDYVHFDQGTGVGAYANVSLVSGTGAILSIQYVGKPGAPNTYPLGGIGYGYGPPPVARVVSATGTGAIISVPGILGAEATFSVTTDRTGAITTVNVSDYGEDYIAAPKISLDVQDVLVSNLVSISSGPAKGDTVYQYSNGTVVYTGTVDSSYLVQASSPANTSYYAIRVYNFTGSANSNPISTLPILVKNKTNISMNVVTGFTSWTADSRLDASGAFISYGDGNAKATAQFLNGLLIGQGQYLDTSGQPSSFDILQSNIYNNYTYQITLEKEIAKYRNILYNLLHPSGMQAIGRYALKSQKVVNTTATQALYTGNTLYHYLTTNTILPTIYSSTSNPSNNIIKFVNWFGGLNVSDIFLPNVTTFRMITTHGQLITGDVVGVNNTANTLILKQNVWTTFANAFYATGTAGSNTINITNIYTGINSYATINGGLYSNTAYPLHDLLFGNNNPDTIVVANNTVLTVATVDYPNNIAYLTTNLANNFSSNVTVYRTFVSNTGSTIVFGASGIVYTETLLTEDGREIQAENGNTILID
jgi:hypothetical protein